MTNEEAKYLMIKLRDIFIDEGLPYTQHYVEAYDMAIKALEQEPCEDAISRQAVLNKKELVELEDGQSFYCISPEDVETLLPVTPQPKPGHWIPVSERLPKESDGTVLITVNGEVRTGQYSEFSNTWYKGDMGGVGGNDPKAWMPLPKPYEKQESEEQE